MIYALTCALVITSGAACVLALLFLPALIDVRRLMEWKRQIEGKTDFGDWLLVSKQEWDDFRKYFYAFEWDTRERIRKLERRREIVLNKWKPWAR